MKIIRLIYLLSFLFLCLNSSFSQFKYYDREFNTKLLSGIKFDVDEFTFDKDSTVTLFDKTLPVKIFKIKAKIRIQTVCTLGIDDKWDTAFAYFSFIAGHDSDYSIHDRFVDSIYNYWKSKDSNYIRNYRSLPCEYGIYYYDGDYILYTYPLSFRIQYLLWFNKRIIGISLLGLEEGKKGGAGASSLFKYIKFYGGNLNPMVLDSYKSDFPPEDFMMLYEGGKFNKRRPIDEFYENHF